MMVGGRKMQTAVGLVLTALVVGISAWAGERPLPDFLNKVQLHNFDGFEPTPDGSGVTVYRLPAEVREHLSAEGARQMTHAFSSEVRFVLKDGAKLDDVVIHLKSTRNSRIEFYQGDELKRLIRGLVERKNLQPYVPPSQRKLNSRYPDKACEIALRPLKMRAATAIDAAGPKPAKCFAEEVCRIVLNGGVITLTGIEGDIRPPTPEELPPVLVSYGTSISMGARASQPDRSFTALTAAALGYSLRNLGCSGNAFCEPEMADYLAEQPAGLYLLEISVNMAGNGYSVEEFKKRAGYMIDRLAGKTPKVPVVCISILTYNGGDHEGAKPEDRKLAAGYRKALEQLCKESQHQNVLFVSGPDLLSFDGLSRDGIHPSDAGMAEIASKLVPRIREFLGRKPG